MIRSAFKYLQKRKKDRDYQRHRERETGVKTGREQKRKIHVEV